VVEYLNEKCDRVTRIGIWCACVGVGVGMGVGGVRVLQPQCIVLAFARR
jgi:hypothetical protein